MPSWPELFCPQHLTPPLLARAQVKSLPALMLGFVADMVNCCTGAGNMLLLCTPLPSLPLAFCPQHLALPSLI
ncbi:MAG TPA: hypothetical protein PL187_08750, partial [Caldilinea sp.]|nr:hypothetical protein [Caldilinea sp.]